jgi:hypothetical protein
MMARRTTRAAVVRVVAAATIALVLLAGGASAAAAANRTNNNAANKGGRAAAAANRPSAAPLASSAILFYTKEYSKPQFGEAKSRCEQLVDNAWAEGGSDFINFVPTYYVHDDGSAPAGEPAAKSGPRASCKPDNWHVVTRVGHYCYKSTWDAACLPPTKADIDEFAQGFARCVAYARTVGFNQVLMSPHIDDALGKGLWRNMIDFKPLENDKYGNSYWSVLLGPTLRAGMAAAAVDGGTNNNNHSNNYNPARRPPFTLWLGLQGEMGRPVFSDPAAWSDAAKRARDVWASQKLPQQQAQLRVGVLLPYRMVAGVNNYGLAPESEPLQEPENTPLVRLGGSEHPLPFTQWPLHRDMQRTAPQLATLFRRDLDFLGISNYVKSPGPVVGPRDLDKAFKIAADEIKTASSAAPVALDVSAMARGLDAKRAKDYNKPPLVLMWSEFGIGGGRSRCGDSPAKSPSEAGRWPHSGSYSAYSHETDPWVGQKAAPGLRKYRRDFHQAALDLLAEGGSAEFPLHSAWLWSLSSWDPQAVNPASRASGGGARTGYWDGEIAGAIRAHNARIAQAAAR